MVGYVIFFLVPNIVKASLPECGERAECLGCGPDRTEGPLYVQGSRPDRAGAHCVSRVVGLTVQSAADALLYVKRNEAKRATQKPILPARPEDQANRAECPLLHTGTPLYVKQDWANRASEKQRWVTKRLKSRRRCPVYVKSRRLAKHEKVGVQYT